MNSKSHSRADTSLSKMKITTTQQTHLTEILKIHAHMLLKNAFQLVGKLNKKYLRNHIVETSKPR